MDLTPFSNISGFTRVCYEVNFIRRRWIHGNLATEYQNAKNTGRGVHVGWSILSCDQLFTYYKSWFGCILRHWRKLFKRFEECTRDVGVPCAIRSVQPI